MAYNDKQAYLRKTSSPDVRTSHDDFFSKSEEPKYVIKGLLSKRIYDDLHNIMLLIFLYTIQGIPIGLAFGSIPFLLQQSVSYTDLGIFSLVGYPYSLKLLWAPIVDTIYSPLIGRRKSWIIPVQLCSGLLMLWMSWRIDDLLDPATLNVYTLSFLFFLLILLAATQDIAVDGWALTILSKENTSLAATCQTIGLNTGYFSSFTIFLAFNSHEFCNKYIRSVPQNYGMIELGGYLQFWAFIYLIFTIFLLFIKNEKATAPSDNPSTLRGAYKQTMALALRPHVFQFMIALVVCKIGFIAAESVTALELIARGFKKEDLALFVLLDFPIQIFNAIFAGRVAKSGNFNGWFIGYLVRLLIALLATFLVMAFPSDGVGSWYFILVLLFSLASSSNSTFMFVSMGGFFAKISDASIGGTYLTLLNTVSNLGGTWPKFPILFLVDFFSVAHCEGSGGQIINGVDCLSKSGIEECGLVGTCVNDVEGFYIVNILFVLVGFVLFFYLKKVLTRVQNVDMVQWQVNAEGKVDLSGFIFHFSIPTIVILIPPFLNFISAYL